MDTTPSPNPTEGRRPASRIRILTAGAAVVGVAATAGIGFVVASGGLSPVDMAAVTEPQATAPAGVAAPDLPSSTQGPAGQGNQGRHGQPPGLPGAPGGQRPIGAPGPGDASTGGS
jgi:hypothetical protein